MNHTHIHTLRHAPPFSQSANINSKPKITWNNAFSVSNQNVKKKRGQWGGEGVRERERNMREQETDKLKDRNNDSFQRQKQINQPASSAWVHERKTTAAAEDPAVEIAETETGELVWSRTSLKTWQNPSESHYGLALCPPTWCKQTDSVHAHLPLQTRKLSSHMMWTVFTGTNRSLPFSDVKSNKSLKPARRLFDYSKCNGIVVFPVLLPKSWFV